MKDEQLKRLLEILLAKGLIDYSSAEYIETGKFE